jgi:hypothetical protein
MKTLFKLLVIIGLLGAGAWYWYSPRVAAEGLRAAARAGDAQQLEQRIDLPAVRENLKADVRAYMAERVERGNDGPLARLGFALGTMVVDGLVDAFVSPGGLALLARGQVPRAEAEAEPAADADDDYRIDRAGLNRFLLRFEAEDADGPRPVLEFARRGLGWKLVRIIVPGLTAPQASAG